MKRKFVVLFHEMANDSARTNHWDLMLECDGYLETWSLCEIPGPGKILQGKKLHVHRIEYLTYEGDISNDRGKVKRILSGQYAGEIAPSESPQNFTLEFWFRDEQLSVGFRQLDEANWEIRF